jgi:dienelactone hydrolase
MRKHFPVFLILNILAWIPCAWPAAAMAEEELVKFDSAPFLMGQIQQRQARERGETPTIIADTIEGYLSKPDGSGPFPAVVYLHGCGGLSQSTRHRVADLMTGWGYVVLAVDSFATRGIKQSCDQMRPNRQGDAWGALSYLSGLGFVDPNRIAIVGSSQGAMVALRIASERSVDIFAVPEQPKFRALVAYYPMCRVASDQLTIPAIVLIGELDDWAPASDCENWMRRRAGKGAPVKLVTYPRAYHAFDVPSLGDGRRMFGHWLKYDADATERSVSEMHDFLQAQFAN